MDGLPRSNHPIRSKSLFLRMQLLRFENFSACSRDFYFPRAVRSVEMATLMRPRSQLEFLESRTLLSGNAAIADANGDGRVDSLDAVALIQHFNQSAATPASGDLNYDGIANALDFAVLASSYGAQIQFSPPLLITRGGTYSGAWQSTSVTLPATRVHTTEPVIIENSVVKGRGPLIVSDYDHTDITIRNTRGYALNPNVAGQSAGRFFDADLFDRAVLEHNYLQGTSGIVLRDFAGDRSADTTIRITNNVALNIDGRRSDGLGGYFDFNTRTSKIDGHSEDGFDDVQFFQLGNCADVANVNIAWNQVTNEPGNSRVEDNISIYKSSGTSNSPIR